MYYICQTILFFDGIIFGCQMYSLSNVVCQMLFIVCPLAAGRNPGARVLIASRSHVE